MQFISPNELLLARDRTRYGAFNLTHEAVEQILSVSRGGVSLAAGLLQMNGLIRYARGRITLLNPKGFEDFSCEYYRIFSRTVNFCSRLIIDRRLTESLPDELAAKISVISLLR
jgi:hypothetical protein